MLDKLSGPEVSSLQISGCLPKDSEKQSVNRVRGNLLKCTDEAGYKFKIQTKP